MSVAKQDSPAAARFARWALGCAVRHWPEENRAWGLALAAEIDETANAFEAVRWSLGGIMFFTRSVLSSAWKWMKLPAGSSLPGANGPEEPSLLPKRSRVFTAAILAAAALLLVLPQEREAITTVRASWSDFQKSPADLRALGKLADRAEKENDARVLAFVALSKGDSGRSAPLADRAVSLDPSLAWIYSGLLRDPEHIAQQQEWLARLQASDPDNAFPDMLAADVLAEPHFRGLYEHHSPTEKEIEATLASDPQWTALMQRAFRAPRYDSYFRRHCELTADVWSRESYLSPSIIVYGLWSHAIPNLMHVKMFAMITIHRAQEARAAGHLEQAEEELSEVASFGRRMDDQSATDIERIIALNLSAEAVRELGSLYANSGRIKESQEAAAKLQKIEERQSAFRPYFTAEDEVQKRVFQRYALLVQGSVLLMAIAAIVTLIGVLALELSRRKSRARKTTWRRALCLTVDFAPATLFAASIAFLLSFRPFERVLAESRSAVHGSSNFRHLATALWSLFEIPEFVEGADTGVSIWLLITVALTVIAVFIVVRSFYRARRAAVNPA
jgi:hypothetical protein